MLGPNTRTAAAKNAAIKLAFPIEGCEAGFVTASSGGQGRNGRKPSSFYICVAQNIAQYRYISAVHHKVAAKVWRSTWVHWPSGELNTSSLLHAQSFSARRE
ncbi:hypothetical protein KCP78_13165 [Salmonella enterica subsp. enterica]|nr:hypothetical protein KCP78_13165 [Salmonella enterica subsp. enterica]